MKKKDFILALLVVIMWGVNFTIIKIGLSGLPSMVLVALRYFFTAIPAIFFIKPPKIEIKLLILYGLTVGFGQFACLFYAMEIGMPAGLASILLQLHAFISPILGTFIFQEKLKAEQVIGFIIAGLGLFFIGKASISNGVNYIPTFALFLTILASTFWAISNIIAKISSNKANSNGEKLDTLALVVWSALIPPLPLLGMGLLLDSPLTIIKALTNLTLPSIFSIIYLVVGATLFGYGTWSELLSKYPLGKITPLALLIPVTGLLSARIILLEKLSILQWIGALTILIGLIISNIDLKKIKSKEQGLKS